MVEADTVVQGKLQLNIEKDGLQAVLVFSPDARSLEWNASGISDLVQEKQLEGVSGKRIAEALMVFSSAGSQRVSFVLSEGIAPEAPLKDIPEWTDCPVPEEMTASLEHVLRTAPEPEVFEQREEKVKREKIIRKKSQFPFVPVKEEKTFVYEKVVRKTPVEIDRRLVSSGFVKAGDVIAKLKQDGRKKIGKDVFGNDIIHPGPPRPAVYPGNGVLRQQDTLVAEVTGFLRRGENWVDVLPYAHHEWDLQFSRDRGSCMLSYTPGKDSSGLPKGSDVRKAVAREGYPLEYLLSEAEIDSVIIDTFRSETPLSEFLLSRDRDAEIKIQVSPDKLEARLYLKKGLGRGNPLDLKVLGKVIRDGGFKGVDLEKVRSDILSFYRGPNLDLSGYVLVRGSSPARGDNREARYLVEMLSQEETEELKEDISSADGGECGITSVDLLPLSEVQSMARVSRGAKVAVLSALSVGKPGKDIYGNEIPGIPGNDPSIRLLENLRLDKDTIIAEADGLLEIGRSEDAGGILLRVRPHRDSRIEVSLSGDFMKAWLTITTPEGSGRSISYDDVNGVVEEKGIVKGIISSALNRAVQTAAEGSPVEKVLIAEGLPPQDGGESRLQFRIQLKKEKDVTIKADGSADFRNQQHIIAVREGELFAEILPPQILPREGWDVMGRVLPAKQPPPLRIQIGRSVIRDEGEDGLVLLKAGTTGELVYGKDLLEIRNVHLVPGDVDFKSGNIRFPGSVHIKGSVLPGFSVFAGNDILVEQVVQAALLSADGNIFVKLGVKGNGKGVLRTKKNISIGFAEQAVLLCVGDVKVERACMLSQVRCNGKLILSPDKGILVGGSIKARQGLSVRNLGAESGVRTEISFGQDYLIADQIDQEDREIQKLKKQIAQLDFLMKKKEKEGDRAALDTIRREKLKFLKLIEKRGFRLFTLREKFEEHFSSEILIHGTLYPGVIFESHGRFLEIRSVKKHVRIFFNHETGRIQEAPIAER